MSTVIQKIDRRNFLKTSAAATGGLVLGFYLPGRKEVLAQSSSAAAKLNAFIQIGADDTVLLTIHKPDMGTNCVTSLSMLLAEELECDWKKIKTRFADTVDPVYGVPFQGAFGSTAVRTSWDPLRKAGATACEMLLQAAADKWGIPKSQCRAESGGIRNTMTNARLTYGSVAEAASKLEVPRQASMKDPSTYRLIGTAVPSLDTPDKVTGKTTYGIDVRMPGMLYASLERCPVSGGSVKSFDATAAKAIPGVKQVVQISNGVAVVAENTWAAMQGRKALKIQWDEGVNATASTESLRKMFADLAEKPGAEAHKVGDVQAALANASKKVEATYESPYLAHATMEPMNCTARVTPDECEFWGGIQIINIARGVAAKASGVPEAKVKLHPMYLGGGFGRRGRHDFVHEAVEIAKAVGGGVPVKLTWTREDDMMNDGYRPMALARFSAGLDDQGWPTAFVVRMVAPSFAGLRNGVDFIGVSGISTIPYEVSNSYVDYHAPYAIPDVLNDFRPAGFGFGVDFWRAPGPSTNTFFRESFIDELAVTAGKDPVEFRRRLLAKSSPRLLAALELTAEKAGWGKPLPAGRFRGVAVDDNVESYSAQIVEVSINQGKVRVHRVVTAIECGRIVNTKGVIQQVESGVNAKTSSPAQNSITLSRHC